MEVKEGSDSADPQKLKVKDLSKRRSERAFFLKDYHSWISSLDRKILRLEPQRPGSFTGLPKDTEKVGLGSDTLFPLA